MPWNWYCYHPHFTNEAKEILTEELTQVTVLVAVSNGVMCSHRCRDCLFATVSFRCILRGYKTVKQKNLVFYVFQRYLNHNTLTKEGIQTYTDVKSNSYFCRPWCHSYIQKDHIICCFIDKMSISLCHLILLPNWGYFKLHLKWYFWHWG